jgi:hypothetical protein
MMDQTETLLFLITIAIYLLLIIVANIADYLREIRNLLKEKKCL